MNYLLIPFSHHSLPLEDAMLKRQRPHVVLVADRTEVQLAPFTPPQAIP